MSKLILTKRNDDIVTLYELTCPLYCDIVQFHIINSPHPKDFFIKHGKIIKLFYSLREKYRDDPSCENMFLFYIFSVFCKHSYIGETIDMICRKLSHTRQASNPIILHFSILFFILLGSNISPSFALQYPITCVNHLNTN